MYTATSINSVSFNAYAPHIQTHKTISKPEITINNFHLVDDTLMRGSKPNKEQLQELKSNGVKTIISFCTNCNPLNPNQKPSMPTEAKWANNLGMNFYWLPFRSDENPPDEYVKTFFNIVKNAKSKGEKVFIHCRYGADRTGLFSALYRIKENKAKLPDVFKELMAYGHDATENPNIIQYILAFKEKQTFSGKITGILHKILHKNTDIKG